MLDLVPSGEVEVSVQEPSARSVWEARTEVEGLATPRVSWRVVSPSVDW
jgi:hypothetical protein